MLSFGDDDDKKRERVTAHFRSGQMVLKWQSDGFDDAQANGQWLKGDPMEIQQ